MYTTDAAKLKGMGAQLLTEYTRHMRQHWPWAVKPFPCGSLYFVWITPNETERSAGW